MRRQRTEMVKQITNLTPVGQRGRGRTRRGWWDKIEEDIKPMNITNWRAICKNRREWKRIATTMKTHEKI